MLTKQTSEKVLSLMTTGGDHDAQAVVSVARDVASRGWIIYFVDDRGRLNHCRTMDSVQDDGVRAAILNEAVDECTAGGIDPDALLATDEPTEGEQIAESTRRETTRTTAADVMYSTFRILSPEQAAQARDYSLVRFPPRYGKTAALRQSAAMQAMASVMEQAERVGKMMNAEDDLHRKFAEDRRDPFGIQRFILCEMAKMMPDGWRERAASRWSAQVRAKLAERAEARRDNYAIRVQGEED